MMRALLLSLLALLPVTGRAAALDLFVAPREMVLDGTFHGAGLTVFATAGGPGDLVLVLESPAAPALLTQRKKKGVFWITGRRLRLEDAPGYFAVATSLPFAALTPELKERMGFLPLRREAQLAEAQNRAFTVAFLRLKQRERLYAWREMAIGKRPHHAFHAEFHLPSSVPAGRYRLRGFFLKDGVLAATGETGYTVRQGQIGFALSVLVAEYPLLTGFLSIAVMLMTGLAGALLLPRR